MNKEIIELLRSLKDGLIYFDKTCQMQEIQDEARAMIERLQAEPTEAEIERVAGAIESVWDKCGASSHSVAKAAIKAMRGL